MKTPLIAVVGPTASGKTGLAVALAHDLCGEVISADSRQIYRGLDIGTEKVSTREMRGIPHYGINIASPRRTCSVERWRRHAEHAILSMTRRGVLPIVAGGSGLYVDALVYGLGFPRVPPNAELRARIGALPTEELYAMLQELDPERAQTIEHQNPRRLIRAIEIATALGAVPQLETSQPRYNVTWVGLRPPFAELETRIQTRLQKALRRGLIAETQKLRDDMGLSWKRIDELGMEYRIVASHLRGAIPKKDLEEKLYQGVRRYAKRQLRWLQRNKDIVWYKHAEEAHQAVLKQHLDG